MAKTGPGLYLIVVAEPGEPPRARLSAALAAAPFASVLVTAPLGQSLDAALARPYVDLIQSADVAALIAGDAQLARTLRADGVHLYGCDQLEALVLEAREILGQRYIVGAEARSRHDAMMLGEQGAEYVAFSEPEQEDFISWWAEIFEVPCVAFGVDGPAAAATMARAGADFIAFRLAAGGSAGDGQDQVRAIVTAMASAHGPIVASS